MISKTNYRKWLKSDSVKVRNLAFQAAYVKGNFSLNELVTDYPDLIEINLLLVLKTNPHLWDKFIEEVSELEQKPLKLVTEIIGMTSFYLLDKISDFEKAFDLVEKYQPQGDDANYLMMILLICSVRETRWVDVARKKAELINANIEKPLLTHLEKSPVTNANQLSILEIILDEADYNLKAKVIDTILRNFANVAFGDLRIVGKIADWLEKYNAGLAAFMYYLIGFLKDDYVSLSVHALIIEKVLDLLTTNKIVLPQNQRKEFFNALDSWLMHRREKAIVFLDHYLDVFPNDAGKVFRLYNRVIVSICHGNGDKNVSSCNWFGFLWEKDTWVRNLIDQVFDVKYIKAIRRYGEKNEQTEVYMLALHGALTTDDLIRKSASEILNLFDQTVYLTGCINELLPQLENILQKNKSLALHVNFLLDLLLVRDYPLNHVSVIDLVKVDKFCSMYGLKADNFYEKFKEPLMDLWEKQNEEERIIDILKTELAI